MFSNSQHFGGKGACWSSGMGTKKSDKHQTLTRTCTNRIISWLMHNLNIFGARTSKLTTARTWGKSPPSPFIVYYVCLHEAHIQVAFCFRNPEIPKVGTPATLGPHNFVCRSLIEMMLKAQLYPLSRAFQQYVAHCLHTRKSGRFPTFSGWESNCQFDSQPFFWP
jgi:hypothetical protein